MAEFYDKYRQFISEYGHPVDAKLIFGKSINPSGKIKGFSFGIVADNPLLLNSLSRITDSYVTVININRPTYQHHNSQMWKKLYSIPFTISEAHEEDNRSTYITFDGDFFYIFSHTGQPNDKQRIPVAYKFSNKKEFIKVLEQLHETCHHLERIDMLPLYYGDRASATTN